MPPLLHRRVRAKGFAPAHVAEVGVFLPEDSNVYGWITAGVRATLVEADPLTVDKIRAHFAGRDNLTVHAAAVCDFHGEVELRRAGPSTFIQGLHSPAVVNDGYQARPNDAFTAPAILFSEVDDGSIDLLSIDIEGAEWFVLQHLKSRPAVISVETHGARYQNPRLGEIEAWMSANGYEAWYLDRTDTVYARPDRLPLGPADRLRRGWKRLQTAFRRWRKRLGK
jgi:FkbM family methyltransferase